MTKWKVLISAPALQPVLQKYRPVFERHDIKLLVPSVTERLSEEDLLNLIGDVDGAICGDDRFTERVLRAAPRLKVISKWGTGIDSIDLKAAQGLGIPVKNTPNAFSEPVADTVLGYVLCFARSLAAMDRDIRQGKWQKRPRVSLCESTLGIVGVGNIGRAVARRARAFGMRLIGYDIPEAVANLPADSGIEVVSKETLLRTSDFITLNCTLSPANHHMLSKAEFALMKPSAVVINTARGPLIDEKALIEALREGKIAGAGLDVFEEEPLPADSPLREFNNVMLAPHAANGSPSAFERVHENSIRNLLDGLGIPQSDAKAVSA